MKSPSELMLADIKEKFESRSASSRFSRLYEDDEEFGNMFAVLHEQLNRHFHNINGRAQTSQHYWAEHSRAFIALIDELEQDLNDLRSIGIEIQLDQTYEDAIERCKPWLSMSGGSAVPDDFELIDLVKYEPVFFTIATGVGLKKSAAAVKPKLTMVGEGSYANVFSFVDPDYGKKFAVKRAKRGIDERDMHRFRREYEVMKRLNFPYIAEVYTYDEARSEYRMEFCDETLRNYINKRNADLQFPSRKRIALQFLYGMNHIHRQDLLHRDVSLQNILLKVYDAGAVLVKLSDFGLVKEHDSEFTRTRTEIRGTIGDPSLANFKDYNTVNEIFSIGWVLSYIFTGKEALLSGDDKVSSIVQKCTETKVERRYQDVRQLISDVEDC